LSKGSYQKVLVQIVDHEGYNVLHLVGKFASEGRFGSPPLDQYVLIHSEKIWFKVHNLHD
jgi:hypothetical protein